MSKTAVVFTCSHSSPEVPNDRFLWLGKLIYDVRPNYVIDLGDGADMKSLNTYDTRYPQAIVSQSYQEDIEHYNDAQDKLRHLFRHNKKGKPDWFGFEGNHENRIKKAVALDPRLEGDKYGVSFKHLQTDHWFTEYHEYTNSGPSLANYDGVVYGHYKSGGNYGRALSGKHHAATLLDNVSCSITVGHSHEYHYCYRGGAFPNPIIGHVVGCFKGAEESWAGQANRNWRSGVLIKREIVGGVYDHTWVSLEALRKEYG